MRDFLIAVATVQMKAGPGEFSEFLLRVWRRTNGYAGELPEGERERVRSAVACYLGAKVFWERAACEPDSEAEMRFRECYAETEKKYLGEYQALAEIHRKEVEGILAEIDAFFDTVQ